MTEEQCKLRELRENTEQLQLDDRDNPDSLGYYTTKRVANMSIRALIHECEERLKRFQMGIKNNMQEMARLEEVHPEYTKKWLEVYNKERTKAGFAEFKIENEFNPEWNKLDR